MRIRGIAVWCWGALAVMACGVWSTSAEADDYYRKGTFMIGGGFNNPVGPGDQYFNGSGTFNVGLGRNLNSRLTIQSEYTHNWMNIDQSVIQAAASDSVQFDNAYASVWSITLNGVFRFRPHSDFVPWITGGFGYYKRNLQITKDALVYYPPYFDPWWGWIDGGWAPGEAIAGSRAQSALGYNFGFGIDLKIENGASLFADVRYHYAPMDGVDMQLVPVTFGIRF